MLFSPSFSNQIFGQYHFDLSGMFKNHSTSNIIEEENTYQLVWEDEFEGSELDVKSWRKIERNDAMWGRYMSSNPRLYDVSNGKIRLYCMRNTFDRSDSAQILTAGIETRHMRTFKYGKVEVRARLKGAQGCWPAIWTMPDNWRFGGMENTQRAEIDIMEHLNKDKFIYQTVHSHYIDIQKKERIPQVKVDINKNKYNTYAVEILPTKLVFSVNGKKTFVYEKKTPTPIGQYPFGIEQYLMIDMQYGGLWVKSIRPRKLPCFMDVDWVRIYKLIN